MTNLSYNAISLLIWLKDEAIDINSFQSYPSSIDAQSYLPMSFRNQASAFEELIANNVIESKKIDGALYYLVSQAGNIELFSRLDIYNSHLTTSPESEITYKVVKTG